MVLLLYPKHDLAEGAQLLAGILAKNRQGKKGRIELRFEGAYQRWIECDAEVSKVVSMEVSTGRSRSRDNGL